MSNDTLMRTLGWASAGLGVPQVLAPREFGRAIGVGGGPRQRTAVMTVGVRELAAAAGLLGQGSPAWLWARVGGDLMDLTLLGRALKNHDGRGWQRTAAALAGVVGITAVDVYAAVTRSQSKPRADLTAAVTVTKPAQEVYDQWRRLENLPSFMAHVERGPDHRPEHHALAGHRPVRQDRRVGRGNHRRRARRADRLEVDQWCARATTRVRSASCPRRAAGAQRCTSSMHYDDAGRRARRGRRASYFGEDPHQQLDDDLRRFKQVLETGEVVRSDGAPGGKRARREFPQHPAHPLSRQELAKEARA